MPVAHITLLAVRNPIRTAVIVSMKSYEIYTYRVTHNSPIPVARVNNLRHGEDASNSSVEIETSRVEVIHAFYVLKHELSISYCFVPYLYLS